MESNCDMCVHLCNILFKRLLHIRHCADTGRKHNEEEGGYDFSLRDKLSSGRVLKLCAEVPRGELTEALQDILNVRDTDIIAARTVSLR